MTTTELVVNSIILAFVAGLIVGIAIWDTIATQPWRLKAEAHRVRLARAQVRLATDGHAGTPYRPETVAAFRDLAGEHPSGKPGLRVVGDRTLYSAEWLNEANS
jgi:hypothetical protein